MPFYRHVENVDFNFENEFAELRRKDHLFMEMVWQRCPARTQRSLMRHKFLFEERVGIAFKGKKGRLQF